MSGIFLESAIVCTSTKTILHKSRNRCWNVLFWRAVTLGTWFSTRSLERSQTSAVGKRLQRKTIGIDFVKDYVKIGLRRCDIQRALDGEPLLPVEKNVERRNGNGVLGGAVMAKDSATFDG